MIPRAMAASKFPFPVSMTVAVVSTRVYPLMLPPTMMEAPTSEMTPPNPAMMAARKRGILFDVGHGAGSFYWYVAVQAYQQGFYPDSISTDLHTGSMNAGMKDMTNVMSKMLNLGSPLDQVIQMSSWNPARQIQRTELGHLGVGAEADIAVLRVDRGPFGFVDSAGAAHRGDRMIASELTLRKGRVVWDLNGRVSEDWKTFKYDKKAWTR